MISPDRATVRRLRVRSRRILAATPEMRRRRAKPWFLRRNAGVDLFLRIIALPGIALTTCLTGDTSGWLSYFAYAWTTLMCLSAAARISGHLHDPDRLAITYVLPISDGEAHRVHAQDAARSMVWIFTDWLAVLAAATALDPSSDAAAWAAIVPGAALQALTTFAVGALLFVLLPRLPWAVLNMLVWVAAVLGMIFFETIPDGLLPTGETLRRIAESTPAAAIDRLVAGAADGGPLDWLALAGGFVAAGMALAACYRTSLARFAPASWFDPDDETTGTAEAGPPVAEGREPIRPVLGATLREVPAAAFAGRGFVEKGIAATLSREKRVCLDVLHAEGASFGRLWMLAGICVAGAHVVTHLGLPAVVVSALCPVLLAFGLLLGAPMTAGRWVGLSKITLPEYSTLACAHLPLRLGSLAGTILIVNASRIFLAVPLIATGALLYMSATELPMVTLQVSALLLAAQPVMLIGKISAGCDDAGLRLAAIVPYILIAALSVFAGSLSLAFIGWVPRIAGLLAMIAGPHALLAIYLWLGCRGRFDLLVKEG